MADAKRLLSGILAGPIAFALVFELKYALLDYVCHNRAQWLFWVVTAGGLLLCAYGVFAARGGMERSRFMGTAGIALSIAFAVFIVALSIPHLFLTPCE